MPPTNSKSKKPALTMEQRWAIADAKEEFKSAKHEKKQVVRNGAKNLVARTLAKYEKLTQETLAKLPQPASKEEPAPAPAPAPMPAPAPAVVNLITEDDIPTEEED